MVRQCSRNGCRNAAVATLTYVYRDQTAILGPLATVAEPHCYDLCAAHSERMTAPRGWEVVRLAPSYEHSPSEDDLLALANAVREAGSSPSRGGCAPRSLPMSPSLPTSLPMPRRSRLAAREATCECYVTSLIPMRSRCERDHIARGCPCGPDSDYPASGVVTRLNVFASMWVMRMGKTTHSA